MPDNSSEFRDRLFTAEQMTPALREAYQREMDNMLHPSLTMRTRLPGIGLLLIMLVCVGGIVRAAIVYHPAPLILTAWAILAAAFSYASYLIVRDLWKGTHTRKAVFSIAQALTFAAGSLTVVALIMGLRAPSDPKSTFNAFYVFIFYFACIAWSLDNRIAASEMASREQLLRIECRLAELAERK